MKMLVKTDAAGGGPKTSQKGGWDPLRIGQGKVILNASTLSLKKG
jgi:hypothetical protein